MWIVDQVCLPFDQCIETCEHFLSSYSDSKNPNMDKNFENLSQGKGD